MLLDMSEAKKDGTPILLYIKNPIPFPDRPDLKSWNGLVFVGRHPTSDGSSPLRSAMAAFQTTGSMGGFLSRSANYL